MFADDQAGGSVYRDRLIAGLAVCGRKHAAMAVLLFDDPPERLLRQAKAFFAPESLYALRSSEANRLIRPLSAAMRAGCISAMPHRLLPDPFPLSAGPKGIDQHPETERRVARALAQNKIPGGGRRAPLRLFRQDFVDAGEGVQRAGEADIGQADGERGQQGLLAVAHGGVAAHMGLDLRLQTRRKRAFPRAAAGKCGISGQISLDILKCENII